VRIRSADVPIGLAASARPTATYPRCCSVRNQHEVGGRSRADEPPQTRRDREQSREDLEYSGPLPAQRVTHGTDVVLRHEGCGRRPESLRSGLLIRRVMAASAAAAIPRLKTNRSRPPLMSNLPRRVTVFGDQRGDRTGNASPAPALRLLERLPIHSSDRPTIAESAPSRVVPSE